MEIYLLRAHHIHRILHEFAYPGELEKNMQHCVYDDATIKNVVSFIQKILKNPEDSKILIVEGKDYICSNLCNIEDCEDNKFKGVEERDGWIIGDNGWLKYYGLNIGDSFYAKDLLLLDGLVGMRMLWKVTEKQEFYDQMRNLEEKINIQSSSFCKNPIFSI